MHAHHIAIWLVPQDVPGVLVVQVLIVAIEQDGRVVSLHKRLQAASRRQQHQKCWPGELVEKHMQADALCGGVGHKA